MRAVRVVHLGLLATMLSTGVLADDHPRHDRDQRHRPAMALLPNGVSSGDVSQHSAVLWARSSLPGPVRFTVYERRGHGRPVARGSSWVSDPMRPAKLRLSGLRPGTRYVYRVRTPAGGHLDGSFVTAADIGSTDGLRFGVAGDWRGELAPYPAIGNAVERHLDFMVKLGDTIYADVPSPALDKAQAETLTDYRLKHNEVYSRRTGMNAWAKLQRQVAVYAMIDDHEVSNDFAGAAPAASDPRFPETDGLINQTALYRNGLQAFMEYNAIVPRRLPEIGDPRSDGAPDLYRFRQFGDQAAMFMLDARSFRDQELPAVSNPVDPAQVGAYLARSFDIDPATGQPLPHRTMLGQRQLQRLFDDLLYAQDAGITWKFVMVPEPIQNIGVIGASDRFEGYAAERTALLRFIADNGISNVVFVSADIHGSLVNNLTYQPGPGMPQLPTGAFEITAPSVAYDAPFGPTVLALTAGIEVAPGVSMLDAFLAGVGVPDLASFNKLPEAVRNDALAALVNQQLVPLGYDTLGLQDTTDVDATLLQGSYTAVFHFGWTEFDIDASSQDLTVTSYGIAPYTTADLTADAAAVARRTPYVVNRFVVHPR